MNKNRTKTYSELQGMRNTMIYGIAQSHQKLGEHMEYASIPRQITKTITETLFRASVNVIRSQNNKI